MIQWRTPSLHPICVVLASSKILSRLLCLPCSKFRSPVEHTKISLLEPEECLLFSACTDEDD